MKKILVLFMVLLLSVSNLDAKAGSSVSRSSSGGFSKSSTSYGTKSNSTSASTQYSSTATRPSTSSSTTGTASSTGSTTSSAGSKQTTNSAAAGTTSTGSSTTGNSGGGYNNSGSSGSDSGGIGLGGVILGTMAGSTVGTMLGNSINGNHSGGVVNSGGSNGGPVGYNSSGYAPQPNGNGGYNGQGTYTPVKAQDNSWSILGFIWWVTLLLIKIALLAAFIYGLYLLYIYLRKTYMKKKPEQREANLAKFGPLYTLIQRLYQASDATSKKELAKVCTPEMYLYLTNIASENEEKGVTCITSDIEILNITTKDWTEDSTTGYIYHSAKIRVRFLDYTIDSTGEVVEGSNTEKMEDIEVWTFVSENAGKDWRLSAIEQYVR